jgi:hypothetical protein
MHRHLRQVLPELVDARRHSTQLGLAVSDIPVEPVAESAHTTHNLALLVDGRQLREAVLLDQGFSDCWVERRVLRLT